MPNEIALLLQWNGPCADLQHYKVLPVVEGFVLLMVNSVDIYAADYALTMCNIKREYLSLTNVREIPRFRDQSTLKNSEMATGMIPEKAIKKQTEAILHALNMTLYAETLKELTGQLPLPNSGDILMTRYTLSTGHELAKSYLLNFFHSLSDTFEVREEPYVLFRNAQDPYAPVTAMDRVAYNIVAEVKGELFPDEIIIVGAHFDSTSQIPYERAPGAVDDGSGTAAVLVMARALSDTIQGLSKKPMRTVRFVLFSGEEQGILGSKAYVQGQLQRTPQRVVAAILMDMISYSQRHFGMKVEGTRDPLNRKLMHGLKSNAKQYAPNLSVEMTTNSFGSDHVSFQRAGIPAVLAIELDDTIYPNYHRSTDVFNEHNVNIQQCHDIIRAILSTVIHIAERGIAS